MRVISLCACLLFAFASKAQLYFPPLISANWESVSPQSLNWNMAYVDSLKLFIKSNKSKGFMILKDGKIVIEEYYNGHGKDSAWYWASAGKTLTGFCVGMLKQKGKLSLEDTTSQYLGKGWTSMTPEQEAKVKIKHHLTMTTGFNPALGFDCLTPGCLKYLAEPGSRWAYHNGPYTLLDDVIESAWGKPLNNFVLNEITFKTGMTGTFIRLGKNNLFWSKTRSMARFGLMLLAKGYWDNKNILGDTNYFNQSIATQNPENNSYGYLTWLNGKSSHMLPADRTIYNGFACPNAPADAFFALGKNWQAINVVPSQNLVVVRMGEAPGPEDLVSVPYNNKMWYYLNKVFGTNKTEPLNLNSKLQYNPESGVIQLNDLAIQNLELLILVSEN